MSSEGRCGRESPEPGGASSWPSGSAAAHAESTLGLSLAVCQMSAQWVGLCSCVSLGGVLMSEYH